MRITNELGLPQPFVDAARSDYTHTEKRYSVTSLLKGVRQAILERRHADEIERDAADSVWAVFGSAVHKILEESQETDTQIKEGRVEIVMPNGYTVSGIFDLYDAETKTIADYKTATVWKVIYDDWDDYRRQLLMYAVILQDMGFEVERGQIVALLKDHSKTKAKREDGYPAHPVHVKEFDFQAEDIEAMRWWMEHRVQQIEYAETLPDEELPLCSQEERWATPDTWAVYKKGNKKASRVFDTETEASMYREDAEVITGKPHWVEFRPGTSKRCADYCSACEFCNQWANEGCADD